MCHAGRRVCLAGSAVVAGDAIANHSTGSAGVSEDRLGKFLDLSEMKTLQETILELARSQSVVQATLMAVGAPRRYRRGAEWPTSLDVEDFRDAFDMRPPGGAEFGKTEVFYISIRDSDRQRASALVAALCSQLEPRMQHLRGQRAQGMVAELERTVVMAESDLAAQTQCLSEFEARIGADLAELRNLNADLGGQSEVAQELQAIEAERRANEARHQENQRLLRLLTAAQHDPQQLLATPTSLLQSQPAVSQLKNALVEAQIRRSNLLGSRSEKHPLVRAAREAEELIIRQLHDELAVATRALDVDIELNATRERALADRWNSARERLARLAGARAEYSNLLTSVANHTRLVEAARKNLADARARQSGARSASVISRIDGVEAGVRPMGPRRATIVAAGGLGGLILGFGLIFLFATPTASHGIAPEADHIEAARAIDPSTTARVATAGKLDVQPTRKSVGNFGMFQGLTLEQAIRSAQQRG
jgi:polysaccharide biosynthesis transport protein